MPENVQLACIIGTTIIIIVIIAFKGSFLVTARVGKRFGTLQIKAETTNRIRNEEPESSESVASEKPPRTPRGKKR